MLRKSVNHQCHLNIFWIPNVSSAMFCHAIDCRRTTWRLFYWYTKTGRLPLAIKGNLTPAFLFRKQLLATVLCVLDGDSELPYNCCLFFLLCQPTSQQTISNNLLSHPFPLVFPSSGVLGILFFNNYSTILRLSIFLSNLGWLIRKKWYLLF